MAKRRRQFDLPNRILTVGETASYLGRSLSWLVSHRSELEANGFPKPLPTIGGYDREAIDRWIDSVAGAKSSQGNETTYHEAWLRASNGES